MMNSFQLCASFLFFFSSSSFAWVGNHGMRRANSRLFAVETITLETLDNHDEEGSLMAASIVRWLDAEWMPQEVHVQMAERAKQSYVACREAGEDDVTDVLMKVSNDLHENWGEYDKDAFVNAWDIGNYAADYLTKRLGIEGCECSTEIV